VTQAAPEKAGGRAAWRKTLRALPGRRNVQTSKRLEVFDQCLSIALRQLRSDHAFDFLVLVVVLS
jgi:hypothetical protein